MKVNTRVEEEVARQVVEQTTATEDEWQEYICAVCYFDPETKALREGLDHILTLCGKVDDPDEMAKDIPNPDMMCPECRTAVVLSMMGKPFICGHTMYDVVEFQRGLGLTRLNGLGNDPDPAR